MHPVRADREYEFVLRMREVGVSGSLELGARGPGGVVTAGPWVARDAYIAETAVAIDRLSAKIERLERREEALAKQVAELIQHAQQTSRFQALMESLRNSRDYKLDEMMRQLKDVRARVETMEGPRADYNSLTYKTFIAVDRKLAEIEVALSRPAPTGRRRLAVLAAAVTATAFALSVTTGVL